MSEPSLGEGVIAPARNDIAGSLFVRILALLREVAPGDTYEVKDETSPAIESSSISNSSFAQTLTHLPSPVNIDVFRKCLRLLEEEISTGSLTSYWEGRVLIAVAACLDIALVLKYRQAGDLMRVLADASRQPRWRLPFGQPNVHANLQYPDGLDLSTVAKSVLSVGLKILSKRYEDMAGDVTRNALRLIANCCADTNQNRKVVLEQSGVRTIMELADSQIEPDFLVVALFNVCYDYEPPKKSELLNQNIQSPAERLTSLNPAQSQLGEPVGADQKPAIQVLLSLTPLMSHEERMPFLAELVEMASLSVLERGLSSLGIEGDQDKKNHKMILTDLMDMTIIGPGARLATYNESCRTSVCNAAVNLLSEDDVKRVLISQDLIAQFVDLVSKRVPQSEFDDEEDPEVKVDLLKCRSAVLHIFYDVCAMPEFTAIYHTDSPEVKSCVKMLKSLPKTLESGSSPSLLLAYSCVLLASVIISDHAAEDIVKRYHIIPDISDVLLVNKDPEVLYPAVNIVGRLARSAANKEGLLQYGMLGALRPFFQMDANPVIQREAVISARRLITESPQSLVSMENDNILHDQSSEDGYLDRLLELFSRTDDRSIRLEIGRFIIEVCRTLWNSAKPRPEDAENQFASFAGSATTTTTMTISAPIAFVAQNGEGQGAQGEGWFGLAMMTVWDRGRALVVASLEDPKLRAEVNKVVESGTGPSFQNLRLLLAKLHLVQRDIVTPETRVFLETAAKRVGLDKIWPE